MDHAVFWAKEMEPAPGPTLSTILDTLGSHALRLVTDAGRLEARIGEIVVSGPGEPLPTATAPLLLLTGSGAPLGPVHETIRQAGRSGYRAVVVKDFGDNLDALAVTAGEVGVALLRTPNEMTWRQLDALLTASRSIAAAGALGGRFAEVVAGDLFALSNAIASAVGGAVSIEDTGGQVLAYSNLPGQEIDSARRMGILGRQAPVYPSTGNAYQQVLGGEGAVHVMPERPEYAERLGIAIRAGNQVLGTIWVISDRPPLVEEAAEVLEDAGRSAALHLLRTRTQADPERAARCDALRTLLNGSRDPRSMATRLAIRADAPTVVLAVTLADRQLEPLLGAARIVDLVNLYCESWHSSATCVADSGTVYALLPTDGAAEPSARLMKLADDLSSTIRRSTGMDVLVAIGSPANGLAEVATSRRMADRVLRVLSASGGGVADVERVRSQILLHALADLPELVEELRLKPVTALVEHDALHGTAYAQTLLAYFGALGDSLRVASELVIHENTVRYRVRRAQEMFGIDLSGPDHLLATWLQLRLLQLRQ
ncbi:helix-turn-helix domain-containing protein [Nonomuraea sp. NPDC050404]|uniref:PucR family transcriptional regulator n=1 Tax=Nonomuraea sp. NPDC050404 TaxID=3155783 RepID=UPI0033FA5F38